jgi:succinate-semialdehyde dehydrogenase/glutarate-semialdehyde dehydrogenase
VLLSIADAGPEGRRTRGRHGGPWTRPQPQPRRSPGRRSRRGERGEILRRAFDLVTERTEDFGLLMTLETGKPLAEARGEVT